MSTKLSSKLKFSKTSLLMFLALFAVIGGYLIFRSQAAGDIVTYSSFENGNLSEYADPSCGGSKVSIVTSPVRQGKYAGFIQTDSNTRCYDDNSMVRVHLNGFPSGTGINLNNGSTFWRAVSLRIPSTNTNNSDFTTVEIHQTSDGGCKGSAPFNLAADGGRWKLIIRGYDDCTNSTFISHIFGKPNSTCDSTTRICHSFVGASDSIQTDQWYDFLLGWHMATDNTGWFEAWMNGPGTGGKSINVVPRINAPTTYPAPNYPMDSVYYNMNNSLTKVYYDGGAYSSDFNALVSWQNSFTNSWSSTPTPPSPTVSISSNPSSVTSPQSSTLTWSSTNATSCTASGAWTGTKPLGGTQTVTPTTTSTYTLACTGAGGTATQSATVTVTNPPSTPTVTSSINDGDTIANGTTWSVTVSPTPSLVEFWANGSKLADDTTSPYSTVLNLPTGTNRIGFCATVNSTRNCFGAGGVYATITITNPTTKPGHLNNDNQVNITDMSILLSNYGTTNTVADINKDGTVNITDLSILLSNYGT